MNGKRIIHIKRIKLSPPHQINISRISAIIAIIAKRAGIAII